MSDQYPRPGQPGEQPPTQIAPQGGVPPQGYPGPNPPGVPGGPTPYPGGGYPPGGYPPPGGPGGPGGFAAPPTGGGGKKGLIIGIVAAVVVLVILAGGAVTFFLVRGDDDDEPRAKVTRTTTVPPSESGSSSATPSESSSDVDAAGDPTTVAQTYLDALVEGDCATVESVSTDAWFQSEYGDQAGCSAQNPMGQMSAAEYDFDEPVVTGTNGSVSATVAAPDGTLFYANWVMTSESGTWLVDGFAIIEG